jgi:BirA family biotin operon repressor/biotin-[acetyl-CoA-carboxylase] ligase
LPNGILTLAGAGSKLHGFHNRPWVALPGNIHLCVHLAPQQPIPHFAAAFMMLAAVSVIDAIDTFHELRGKASIKWVNDILIGKAKVAGVLAQTQSQGDRVTSAVLGIGVNVETRPVVPRDPFVPQVTALCDHVDRETSCSRGTFCQVLIHKISDRYRSLLTDGHGDLLANYRERSLVIGREVSVHEDATGYSEHNKLSGKVLGIGDDLELFIEGLDQPVTCGRLVLRD